MAEISGFGGSYEATCRKMLKSGLKWLDVHPEADPVFHGYKGIYGICVEDNEDAKALSKAIIDASNNDATGAMHQAVISSILWIKKNSWKEYVAKMSNRNQ
jgi:hypothetical protein